MDLVSTDRVTVTPGSSPIEGTPYWDPVKSIWLTGMTLGGLIGGTFFFSWDAVVVFILLTAVTICAGHSVGMHRLLIHRSFTAPIWVEHILVYLGALVGMAGPHGIIRLHDLRDWMQAQPDCHDYAAHRHGLLHDYWWQGHCGFALTHPPHLEIEPRILNDRFYRFLEVTWRWQQVPLALVLFALGGWGWVFWGICMRVAASLTGHWLMVHFAHRTGGQSWVIDGLAVQGHDVRGAGLITFGEAWHNNHHAWPQSAKLGLKPGQSDLGWLFIRALAALGLARDIKTPEDLSPRVGLLEVGGDDEQIRIDRARLRDA